MTTPPLPYEDFLRSKAVVAQERGYAGKLDISPALLPFAADIARWAIRGGNRAIFASFGLTKTRIQIQILISILESHPGAGLIVCPLGVKGEFVREAKAFPVEFHYIRTAAELEEHQAQGHRFFLTNYERVRDGDLDPNLFTVVSLDEASVLRSFGSKTYQTFLTLFSKVQFKFVATATPDPNRHKELIHYAGFLGIMDTGQALTRFFKRDSSQAGNLTLHPHKEEEFWLWVSTWAIFVEKPSDLGHPDTGYILPPMRVIKHRIPVDHASAGFDSWGQGKLLRSAATGVRDAAREKRDSLPGRIAKMVEIIKGTDEPGEQFIVWCDLNDEQHAIEKALGELDIKNSSLTGTQPIELRETLMDAWKAKNTRAFVSKPVMYGAGPNMQQCHTAIFLGIGFKFADFIQAVHRVFRFLQVCEVEIHLIYTESEDFVMENLMAKWARHKVQLSKMSQIVKQYGLSNVKAADQMQRSITHTRQEEKGELWTSINGDNVPEMAQMPDNSIDLVVTSWPFSDHYEYVEAYNDFGHNDGDKGFFEQMEYLTPHILRTLRPGRMYCVHAKDRIVYGSVSGDGMYQVNPFSDKCVAHCIKHGLKYCGRITVVTDVVRENNQTYRLGYSENAKDGTKMGVGSSEYVLLFRRLPSDTSKSYADLPVTHPKDQYSRARWQFDAHAMWRSDGNRFLSPEEINEMPMDQLRALWHQFSASKVYDFGEHVQIAEEMEKRGILPSSFMALDPPNPGSPWVWDDITRMRTLNSAQVKKGWEQHVCPLQLDIVERLIVRYSNKGELVLDPFGGLGTVAYCAVLKGRKGYSIELNEGYWKDSKAYLRGAEQIVSMPTLFDMEPEVKA
jgi:DNA modification methylase